LLEALDALMQSPQQFGLIVAPAGFGKTTLLTQWLDERGHDAAWVTFDPSDDDPAIFWTYIIEALHDRHPEVGLVRCGSFDRVGPSMRLAWFRSY
jgi:LuxR family maltose regulon positive regulatory protein